MKKKVFLQVMIFIIVSASCFCQDKAVLPNLKKIITTVRDTTYYDNEIQANCKVETLEYDRNGALIHSLNIENGRKDSEAKYVYAKNGVPLEVVDYSYYGEHSSANFHRYFYDEHGRIRKETFVEYDTVGVPDSSIRIVEYFNVYASNDSLISTIRTNEGFEIERTTFVYGLNGNRKFVERQRTEDVIVISETWKYDDAGLLIASTYQDSSYYMVDKKFNVTYFYNSKSELMKEKESEGFQKYYEKYFTMGREDSAIHFEGKMRTGGEVNTYDKSGKLLLVKYWDIFEGSDGKWVSSLFIAQEYSYDANVNLVKDWCFCDGMNISHLFYYNNNLVQKKIEIRGDKVEHTTTYQYEFY